MSPQVKQALERLLKIAAGNTGQSCRVADFLLAWWNAGSCGAFELVSAWALDDAIVRDMCTVFPFIVTCRQYPDTLGYEREFQLIIREWRPELLKGAA